MTTPIPDGPGFPSDPPSTYATNSGIVSPQNQHAASTAPRQETSVVPAPNICARTCAKEGPSVPIIAKPPMQNRLHGGKFCGLLMHLAPKCGVDIFCYRI